MKVTRRIVTVLTLSAGLVVTSGCASYAVRTMNNPQPRYYPGMREDARMIVEPSKVNWVAPYKTETVIFGALDIVPSGIVDTLELPLELTMPQRTNSTPNPVPELLGANGIQGTWKVVVLEADGKQAPAEVVAVLKLVFRSNTLTFVPGEPGFTNYRYRLDPTAKPPKFIMIHADGSKKGKIEMGIYQWDGDHLEICFGVANRIPKVFTAEAKSGQCMYILEREK